MLLCVLLRFYYNASAQVYHQFLNLPGTAVSRGKFVGLVPPPNVDVGIPTNVKVVSLRVAVVVIAVVYCGNRLG